MLALAIPASAQIQTVDTTTRTTNAVTGSGYLTVTNVCTNRWYTTLNPNFVSLGDSLSVAFGKMGANFSFVEAQIGTNTGAIQALQAGGGSGAGSNAVSWLQLTNFVNTNTLPINLAGGYGLPWSGITDIPFYSLQTPWSGDINGAGYSLTNAGMVGTTNLAVIGTTWLNNSNMMVSYSAGFVGTNGGLIPAMTSSNVPGGLATASSSSTNAYAAFTGIWPGIEWVNIDSHASNWIQYQFPFPVTVSSNQIQHTIYSLDSLTNVLQGSTDGTNWVNLCTNISLSGCCPSFANSFTPYTGIYFRWTINISASTQFQTFLAQLYGTGNTLNANIISNSTTIEIITKNGLMLNGGIAITNWSQIGGGTTVVSNGVNAQTVSNIVHDILGTTSNASYIQSWNGVGLNTTIGYPVTNLWGNVIALLGTNEYFAGTNTFVTDNNTNSWAYTNYYAALRVGMVWWGSPLVYYSMVGRPLYSFTNYYVISPVQVWTNASGLTNHEIVIYNNSFGSTVFVLGAPGALASQSIPYYCINGSPIGTWTAMSGATNPPVGIAGTGVTNFTLQPTIINGQLIHYTYIFIPDATNLLYEFVHGLDHAPRNVEWSWYCISPDIYTNDPGRGMNMHPGQSFRIFSDYVADIILFQDSTMLALKTDIAFLGNEAHFYYSGFPNPPGSVPIYGSYVQSFTNFVLRVDYDP